MPRIELPKGSGEIQFFKFRGGEPEFVIRWPEVQRFSMNLESYVSGEASYPQHVLYLVKKSGSPVPLCGSVDEKLVAGIKTELEGLLGSGSVVTNLSPSLINWFSRFNVCSSLWNFH